MRLGTVKKMKPGDLLLCYLTRASRWVGVLEVTGNAFHDETPIWKSGMFPSRIAVRTVIALDPEFGVPVLDMREELTVFQGLNNPNRWSGPFRGSPAKWKAGDGEAVFKALSAAEANPVERPLGKAEGPAPAHADTVPVDDDDLVTVSGQDDQVVVVPGEEAEVTPPGSVEGTTHTEIQYRLMTLGADMGFDVHLASNDASRVWNGQKLGDMPRRRGPTTSAVRSSNESDHRTDRSALAARQCYRRRL
jgi:hypothetical protein